MKRIGQIKFIWTAIIAIVLAIGAALVLPLLLNQAPLIQLAWPNTKYLVFALAFILNLYFDYELYKAVRVQRSVLGGTSLIASLVLQFVWLLAVGYLLLVRPMRQLILATMTLPLYLVGVFVLAIALGIMQNQLGQIKITSPQTHSLQRWNYIIMLFCLYALIFFGLTTNWITGVTIAIATGLIVDPAWTAQTAGAYRQWVFNGLARKGVVLKDNQDLITDLRKVKNVVIEKSGLLTSPGVLIRTVQSYDDRYSDFDILGIATGLVSDKGNRDYRSPLAIAIKAYADAKGVFASQVSEPEYLPEIGVRGVINNQRFAFVSATYAKGRYDINERHFGQINALGNSVSYVVEGERVIGVVAFHAPANYSIMTLDKFFLARGMQLHVISADTRGSVEEVTQIMNSVVEAEANMAPADKLAKYQELLAVENTILITNQETTGDLPNALVIGVGDAPQNPDIKIWAIEDLPSLWDASDQMLHADRTVMYRIAILNLVLLVLAAGLGILLVNWFFIAPIIAVIVRLIVTIFWRLTAKK